MKSLPEQSFRQEVRTNWMLLPSLVRLKQTTCCCRCGVQHQNGCPVSKHYTPGLHRAAQGAGVWQASAEGRGNALSFHLAWKCKLKRLFICCRLFSIRLDTAFFSEHKFFILKTLMESNSSELNGTDSRVSASGRNGGRVHHGVMLSKYVRRHCSSAKQCEKPALGMPHQTRCCDACMPHGVISMDHFKGKWNQSTKAHWHQRFTDTFLFHLCSMESSVLTLVNMSLSHP